MPGKGLVMATFGFGANPQPFEQRRASLGSAVLQVQESLQSGELRRGEIAEVKSAGLVPVQMTILQKVVPPGLIEVHLGRQSDSSEAGAMLVDPGAPFPRAMFLISLCPSEHD